MKSPWNPHGMGVDHVFACIVALHQAERDSGRVPTTLGSALGTGTNFEVLWCPGSTAFRVPTCQCANHRAG